MAGELTEEYIRAHLRENILREEWHTERGRFMREVIFGMNDGLVTTLGFVAGVTGAVARKEIILIAAFAEMAAGAISMFSGAYLSAKSQNEVFQREIERERRAIVEKPREETMELVEIFRQKGFSEEEISMLVRRITRDKELWLETMIRDELGIVGIEMEHPLRLASIMGASFVAGAIIPIFPYLFLDGIDALGVAAIATVVVLFAVGVAKTKLTRKGALESGGEMMLVGTLAAVLGYAIGTLLPRIFAGV